jgi:hypothetical protein
MKKQPDFTAYLENCRIFKYLRGRFDRHPHTRTSHKAAPAAKLYHTQEPCLLRRAQRLVSDLS